MQHRERQKNKIKKSMSNQESGGTLTDKKTVNDLYSDRENVIITSIVLIFHIQVWIRKNPANFGQLCEWLTGVRSKQEHLKVFYNENFSGLLTK